MSAQSGVYADATRAALRVESEQYTQRKTMLQAAIKYEQDDARVVKPNVTNALQRIPRLLLLTGVSHLKKANTRRPDKNFQMLWQLWDICLT